MANIGSFVPTTNIWDVSQLEDIQVNSEEFKELLVRMYQNLNIMSVALNGKDSGYYVTTEFVPGQNYFANPTTAGSTSKSPRLRATYRKVIDFGTLPNAGIKSVAHGIPIDSSYTFTRIYGTASDTTGLNYIPLPYASPTDVNNIELNVDATNVNVITGSNRTNFNITYIVLEYLKQ